MIFSRECGKECLFWTSLFNFLVQNKCIFSSTVLSIYWSSSLYIKLGRRICSHPLFKLPGKLLITSILVYSARVKSIFKQRRQIQGFLQRTHDVPKFFLANPTEDGFDQTGVGTSRTDSQKGIYTWEPARERNETARVQELLLHGRYERRAGSEPYQRAGRLHRRVGHSVNGSHFQGKLKSRRNYSTRMFKTISTSDKGFQINGHMTGFDSLFQCD